jgi:TldD protein
MTDWEKVAEIALNITRNKGATYSDIRIVQTQDEGVSVKNGAPELTDRSESTGFGIRVIADGSWGFAASSDFDPDNVKKVGELAAKIARAGARLKKTDVILATLESSELGRKGILDSYETPIETDPFAVSLQEKLEYLLHLDELMRKVSGVALSDASMSFRKEKKYFASSEGSRIDQLIIHTGAGISATAMKSHRDMATRSYPNSSGQYETKGYELIKELNLEENAERIAGQAVALLDAKACPSGRKTIILDGAQVSLQIHESIGHPLELDRVFGAEKNFSGTSFATPDKLGKLKYASEIVNVVADPTAPGGLGTFGYDDEGVKANKDYLIKDGILVGYLSSRQTAQMIKRKSNASMRAEGWGNVPIVRMTNINLLPQDKTLEDLISETDDGIYMETVSSWSIDDNRENFKMGTEIGREIKSGKLGDMIKKPGYSGNTIEFWNSCDGIADEKHWKIWGTPNCGKGQPAQTTRVGQGTSPCRFRNINVGE